MDIQKYIDEQVEYLFQVGVYDRTKDSERIIKKRDRVKKIISSDPLYKNLSYEDLKEKIDGLVKDAINKHLAKKENNDERRKFYGLITGDKNPGFTLLEKKSITTGEPLEIAYAVIGSGSIHLHCGISRKVDYIDSNGKEITHFHQLLRKLKEYISKKYNTTDKKEIERLCSEYVIEPYIIEVLQNVLLINEQYSHLKTIRLDTNDGFYRFLSPYLEKFGFHPNRENELLEELQSQFPNYKYPEDLEKFYQDYPDRKRSVTIHCDKLKNILESLSKDRKIDSKVK